MLRAIRSPAIAVVLRPWRPKPLATHRPLRNWPICGMPCTVTPDRAAPRPRQIATLPSCGKMAWIRRCDGGRKALRPRRPGGFRAGPHQPVALDDAEMVDAVAVGHRSLKGHGLGQPLAERLGHRGIAPDRQQRFRQPPQRRAEMDVAGEHDMRRAQPRRRRDDPLANAGRIDADDRRVLENARAGAPRQRGKAVEIFAAVDLKRLRIIDAVEIMLVLSSARTRSTCQPSTSVSKSSPSICSRLISASPASTLETSSAPSLSAIPGICASVALART